MKFLQNMNATFNNDKYELLAIDEYENLFQGKKHFLIINTET